MKSHMSRFTLAALAALGRAPTAWYKPGATTGATHPNMAAAHAAVLIGFKHHQLPKMFSSDALCTGCVQVARDLGRRQNENVL
jgi:hypothetical protein